MKFPDVAPVVRPNGESVVEMRMDGELVGEINFTKILVNVFAELGICQQPARPRGLVAVWTVR